MRRRLTILVAALVVALAAGGVAVSQLRDPASDPPTTPQRPADKGGKGWMQSTFTRAEAKGFRPFALYNLGEAYDGLPLTALLREKGKGNEEGPGQNKVVFIYGDCQAASHEACAPPLQVAVHPACRRNPADFDIPADEKLTIRGAPAYFYESYGRLEVVTGRSTVVLFAGDGVDFRDWRSFLLNAAEELRGVNHLWPSDGPLPPAAQGAIVDRLPCAAGE